MLLSVLLMIGIPAALGIFLAIVALVLEMKAPSFDEYGQINECIGCPSYKCPACRYNPEYWDGTTYKGPSRRELARIRREIRNEHL